MELDTKYKRPNIKSDPDGYESGPYAPVTKLRAKGITVDLADVVCVLATRQEMGPLRKYDSPDRGNSSTQIITQNHDTQTKGPEIKLDRHGTVIFVAPSRSEAPTR